MCLCLCLNCHVSVYELSCIPVYVWTVMFSCLCMNCHVSESMYELSVSMYELSRISVYVWTVMCPCLCMNCHVPVFELSCVCVWTVICLCELLCACVWTIMWLAVSVFELSYVRVHVWTLLYLCLCTNCHVPVSMYELSNVRVFVWIVMYPCLYLICRVSVYDLSCVCVWPSTVVITGVDEHHVVTASCRIRPAVGQLVSLQLTRWSSVSDATVTLVQATADSELYTANLPAAVASGRFSQRFINYTFLQVRDFIVTLRYCPNGSWFHSHLEVLPKRFINYTFLKVRDFRVTLRYCPNASSTTPSWRFVISELPWGIAQTLHQLHLPEGSWFQSYLEVLPKRFINYTFLKVRDFRVTLRYRPNASLHAKLHTYGACVYSCNQLSALSAKWPDLLRATAVTRRWNEHRNKSQHRKLTLEKKILQLFLHALEPGTLDHEPSSLTTEPPLPPIPSHSRLRPTACNWILTYVFCRSTVTMTDATNATLRTSWRLETRRCRTVFTCKSEVSAKCCTTSLPIFI